MKTKYSIIFEAGAIEQKTKYKITFDITSDVHKNDILAGLDAIINIIALFDIEKVVQPIQRELFDHIDKGFTNYTYEDGHIPTVTSLLTAMCDIAQGMKTRSVEEADAE